MPFRDAPYFQLHARAFKQHHLSPWDIAIVDNTKQLPQRRKQFLTTLRAHAADVETIAIFSHGTTRTNQFGFDLRNTSLDELVRACVACPKLSTVVFYCCSMGQAPGSTQKPGIGAPGGFADALSDRLAKPNVIVYAHERVADTVKNPYVRRFDFLIGQGGEWRVEPGSALWASWKRKLKAKGSTLPYRFPFMDSTELKRELEAS
jgi:hypothetical protein